MTKLLCDRCGKELDHKNMKYVGVIFHNYYAEDPDTGYEAWDFCHECAFSIKQSIVRNIAEYDNSVKK